MLPLAAEHTRPTHRGECLTAARRYDVEQLYSASVPIARASTVTVAGVTLPTDGAPDGFNAPRPCPFVGCKYHLAMDFSAYSGGVVLMLADDDEGLIGELDRINDALASAPDPYRPEDMTLHTCALDVADLAAEGEPVTLEAIGESVRKTRERIRQVEAGGLARLKPYLAALTSTDLDAPAAPPEDYETLGDGSAIAVYRRGGGTVVVACSVCARHYHTRLPKLRASLAAVCRLCNR